MPSALANRQPRALGFEDPGRIGTSGDEGPDVFHRTRESMGREWLGLAIIQRFLEVAHQATVRDVHRESRDFDLIYQPPGASPKTIDVKVDYYFGAEERNEYHRRRTNCAALETVSSDASGTMGWMVTSEADFILYYFLALDNHPDDVRRCIEEGDAAAWLAQAQVYDDCLLVVPTVPLQRWFWGQKRYLAYRHCKIPNLDREGKTYNTWVRLVPVADLVQQVEGIRLYDRISQSISPQGAVGAVG